jgi:mannose/fructose-specific phosphotransferase system component IIA
MKVLSFFSTDVELIQGVTLPLLVRMYKLSAMEEARVHNKLIL